MQHEACAHYITDESMSVGRQVGGASEGVGSGGQLAVFKTDEIVQYHVGETICGLQKVTLTPGGNAQLFSSLWMRPGGRSPAQPP
jgi:hypothetical protein